MQYLVNVTSMQYMWTSVDTGAEGTLSTIVAGSGKRVNLSLFLQLVWVMQNCSRRTQQAGCPSKTKASGTKHYLSAIIIITRFHSV